LPLQQDAAAQHFPPQALVPRHPSQQHFPSRQTSSGQQQRSSSGSAVPLLQTDAAAQQNSVPGCGGPAGESASAKQSAQQLPLHNGRQAPPAQHPDWHDWPHVPQ
jgi:hypothetical protein